MSLFTTKDTKKTKEIYEKLAVDRSSMFVTVVSFVFNNPYVPHSL